MNIMSSSLENEDLDNGPLVRMEDVQPARDRSCDTFSLSDTKNESIETYVVDHLDYDNECVVDDDDSNIGSMVSIHSEEVVECDDGSNNELIEPDIDQPIQKALKGEDIKKKVRIQPQHGSWPTLEILPGGVIKHSDRYESDLSTMYESTENETESGEMMYACAKCSQSFKYLFCLVKHVRWHEKEAEKQKGPDLAKLTSLEKQLVYLKRARLDLEKNYKKQKIEVLARIASAVASMENVEEIFC